MIYNLRFMIYINYCCFPYSVFRTEYRPDGYCLPKVDEIPGSLLTIRLSFTFLVLGR